MAPIRVAIMGLSTSGMAWARTSHMDYLVASPKYSIVAVCNSSVDSSKLAIKEFGLPAGTKAYGSPEDVANDAEVDLVVCSVRVDRHYDCILPSLKKGKDVYCEWPLAENEQRARELLAAAEKSGSRTVVGLQGHVAPAITKAIEVIESGRIGEVLSSSFVGSPGNGGAVEGSTVRYFVDRKVGGNILTIQVGHTIDFVLLVLGGELKEYSSMLATQRPEIDIIDRKTNEIIERGVKKNTPDQGLIQGYIDSRYPGRVAPLLSFHMRGGKRMPGTPALAWNIYGTKGEISITSPDIPMIQVATNVTFRVFEAESEKDEEIQLDKSPFGDEVKLIEPGFNVARLYEAFADGKKVPDFKHAVKRHALLEEMLQRWDDGTQLTKAKY